MPQIDFESLVSVCGGGDRKVACETLADGEPPPEKVAAEDLDLPPDFPPESFWLSKDAEFDWFDRNAFLDRKDSGKRNSNAAANRTSNPSSQRFSRNLISKASIISLPVKPNTGYIDGSKRRSKKITFLPKRNESAVRSLVEPASPMVSCIGRVRSTRCRRKRSESGPSTADVRSSGKARRKESRWIWLFWRFMARVIPRRRIKSEAGSQSAATTRSPARSTAAVEPPGLGGMMRFASGRRSASSWSADDFDDLTWHVEK